MRRLWFILMCLCLVSLSQAVIIKVEAEDANWWYQSGDWSTFTDAAASGGSYIMNVTENGGTAFNYAEARLYAFPLKAGTYTLYAGCYIPSTPVAQANNDSMYVTDSFAQGDVTGYVTMNNDFTGLENASLVNQYRWNQLGGDYVMSVDGTAYFWAAPRENDFRLDALAFVTKGQTVTNAQLTNSEAYNPEGPYGPVVAPENVDGTVGTLEYAGQWQVSDVVLSFKAGEDLTGTYAVNPEIIRHNIYLQKGLPADANMFLIETLTQSSLVDPNQSLVLADLVPPIALADNVTVQWQVEQVINDSNDIPYPDGNPNNLWGNLWSFKTASAVPVILSISDELTTDTSGFGTLTIETTPIADHYQWFELVGEVGGGDDIKLLDSSPLYEGVTTKTLQITGAAADGSDDAQVYAIAYFGVPGQASTEASAPSETRWFWYPRLMAHYTFETVNGSLTPDSSGSGYDMSLLSGDAGADIPTLNANVPAAPGLASTKSLRLDNLTSSDPNRWAQYGQIAEPTLGRYRNITISVWVYHGGGLYNQKIIDFGEIIAPGTTNNSIYITPRNNDNQLLFNVMTQNVTSPGTGTANAVIPINEWTFVTATLQGDTAKLYVNGEWIASGTITNDPISLGTTGMVNYVGRSTDPADAYFNGYMDDLKIFNYGLTNIQVGQLYLADTLGETVCDIEGFDLQDFDTNDNCYLDLPDLLELLSRWLEQDRIYPAL